MVYVIIVNMMSNYVFMVQVEKFYMGVLCLLYLGDQLDLEWLYVVDCKNLLVNVYMFKQGNVVGQIFYSVMFGEYLEVGFFKDVEWVFCEDYQLDVVEVVFIDFVDGVKVIVVIGWWFNEWEDLYLCFVQ